jgi:hypothetical protein
LGKGKYFQWGWLKIKRLAEFQLVARQRTPETVYHVASDMPQ